MYDLLKVIGSDPHPLLDLFNAMNEVVALHELVFDEAGTPVDYRIVGVNQAFTKIIGIERERAVGKLASEVYEGEPPYLEEYAKTAISGKPFQFETYYPPLDGHYFISVVSYAPNCFATITTEISSLKQLQNQLKHEQRLATIGLLASFTVHDINNPLTVVINYAQLILDSLPKENERLSKFAREIISEGLRIAEIVKNLLSFSRFGESKRAPVRPDNLLRGVLTLIGKLLSRDEIELISEIEPDLPEITCIEAQIQQVLLNLVTNARDAINERYPNTCPEKQLTIRIGKPGPNLIRFEVQDSGLGISEKDQAKIFETFFSTKDPDRGTGLGLAICKTITKEHGGRLWFETRSGIGTSFYLDLPVIEVLSPI